MKIKHLFPKLNYLLFLFLSFSLIHCGGETTSEEAPETETETEISEEAIAQAASWADTAQMKQYVLWDWEGAETAFQKAIELNPNLGRAHAHYGWLHHLRGDNAKGIEEMKTAMKVEPKNPLWHAWHGWMLLWEDDKAIAMEAAKGGLEIDSSFSVSHYIIGTCLNHLGESEKAMEHLEMAAKDPMFVFGLGVGHAFIGNKEKAIEIADQLVATGETWNTWGTAEIYSTLGDSEKAMEWVQKAFDQKHPYIPWIERNPILSVLNENPKYQEIVAAMNLPY